MMLMGARSIGRTLIGKIWMLIWLGPVVEVGAEVWGRWFGDGGGSEAGGLLGNGWVLTRACELSVVPLASALDAVTKEVLSEAEKAEKSGGHGKKIVYADTAKLLRVYDQVQEYLLDCLKNKRHCGRCTRDIKG